jgi:uncharacterized alpha-E superfamily protein
MLSRVAENLYWISRYVERAENIARLLDDGFQLELDAGLTGEDPEAGPVERILTILSCRAEFEKDRPRGPAAVGGRPASAAPLTRPSPPTSGGESRVRGATLETNSRDVVLRFLTFNRQGSHSILAMIALARENARATQEALSAEAWSQINRLYLYLSGPRAQRRFRASPFRFFDSIKRACVLFEGLVDSTLPRTEVFHFLQLGRFLERVDMTSRILNVSAGSPPHPTLSPDERGRGKAEGDGAADTAVHTVHWASLLRSCSAHEAYLREFQDRIDPTHVVRYLVLGADFPRAMRFCVARCLESLREIAGPGDEDGYGSEAERLLGRLDSDLRYLDPAEILGRGLASFLTGVQETCNRIGLEIQQAYFLR